MEKSELHGSIVPKNNKANSTIWSNLSIASLSSGGITFCLGLYKMYIYDSGSSWKDPVNAYVGGDAYNYIINGTYATAFFVLTTMFVLAAIGLMILHYISMEKTVTLEYHKEPDNNEQGSDTL